MRVREAKDFLVQQISAQASLEGVPLPEIEKRMLYFTEGKSAVEDPVSLNNEFEAQCDTAKYEKKISRLMKHAYKRLKKEDAASQHTWDEAIRTLRKGDHYILVRWGGGTSGATIVIGLGLVALYFVIRFSIPWLTRTVPPPNPHLLLATFILALVIGLVFQRRVGEFLSWLLDHTLFWFDIPRGARTKKRNGSLDS